MVASLAQYTDPNAVTGNVTLDDAKLRELQYQVDRYYDTAIGYHEGELGVRVRMGWDYYYSLLPQPVTKGSSKQVMPVVWNSVNGVLSELVSVFTSGEQAVRFAPLDHTDGIGAIAATKLVNKVLLHDNDGYNVLNDAFKECLVARNGFVKRYWKKHKKVNIEEFDEITKDELDVYLSMIDGEIIELETEKVKSVKFDDQGNAKEVEQAPGEKDDTAKPKRVELWKGKVVYETTHEGVCVEYVPFEEVLVEPTARSVADANYFGHRVRKSKNELKQMGFNADVVDSLAPTNSDIEAGVIANSRVNNLSPLNVSDVVMVGDNEADKIWLHENYIKTSVANERPEILQVFTVHNQILEVNIVNEIPFTTFTPFPIPGSIWGESVYDVTKDLQDLGTTTLRGIIDNIMNANFRRYEAVKGQYDRESLMNNRPGAVIEVLTQGSVNPFPHHPLPDGISALLDYVSNEKEERTGVSKAGQGLDPAVFKNDNSTATVQMVMTAALNRVRMVARNIAYRGMMDLMLGIYNLVRTNGREPITVDTAQGPVTIMPHMLPAREKMVASVAIGSGERGERARNLQSVLMAMTQIPQMGAFLQSQNAYYLATQLMEAAGIYDTENYLTPPDQLPPPQPDPMAQLQQALLQEQIKGEQVKTQKLVADTTLAQQRHEFEQQKAADEMDMKRGESMSAQDRDADAAHLELQKLQLEQQKLQLELKKLEQERQKILIEAQMETKQKRGVALEN